MDKNNSAAANHEGDDVDVDVDVDVDGKVAAFLGAHGACDLCGDHNCRCD